MTAGTFTETSEEHLNGWSLLTYPECELIQLSTTEDNARANSVATFMHSVVVQGGRQPRTWHDDDVLGREI